MTFLVGKSEVVLPFPNQGFNDTVFRLLRCENPWQGSLIVCAYQLRNLPTTWKISVLLTRPHQPLWVITILTPWRTDLQIESSTPRLSSAYKVPWDSCTMHIWFLFLWRDGCSSLSWIKDNLWLLKVSCCFFFDFLITTINPNLTPGLCILQEFERRVTCGNEEDLAVLRHALCKLRDVENYSNWLSKCLKSLRNKALWE